MPPLDCGLHPPEKQLDLAYPSLCGVKIRRYLAAFYAGDTDRKVQSSIPHIHELLLIKKITMCSRLKGRIIYTLVLHDADEVMAREHYDNGAWDPRITTVLDVLDQQVWHLCGARWEDFCLLQKTMLYSVSKLAKAVAAKRAGRSIDAQTLSKWRDDPTLAKAWVRSDGTIPRQIDNINETINNLSVLRDAASTEGVGARWAVDRPSDHEMNGLLSSIINAPDKPDVFVQIQELEKRGPIEAKVCHYLLHLHAWMRAKHNTDIAAQLMDGNEGRTTQELTNKVISIMVDAESKKSFQELRGCHSCTIE